jgi:small subunit ribosomal protein S20
VANIKSADKRNRQMIKNRTRNRAVKSALRTVVKKARTAVDVGGDDAAQLVRQAIATIDKAVSKGVLKRQTASRYVSRLAKRARAEAEGVADAAE